MAPSIGSVAGGGADSQGYEVAVVILEGNHDLGWLYGGDCRHDSHVARLNARQKRMRSTDTTEANRWVEDVVRDGETSCILDERKRGHSHRHVGGESCRELMSGHQLRNSSTVEETWRLGFGITEGNPYLPSALHYRLDALRGIFPVSAHRRGLSRWFG